MRFFYTSRSGFTLVEVLVVVAVAAVLSTIAIAGYGTLREKARDYTRVSDLEGITLALRLYKEANSEYPTGHDLGTVLGEGGSLDSELSGVGKYFPSMPSDPMGVDGSAYEYVYDSDHDDCLVAGVGMNRKIVYAKNMEIADLSNWDTVCGGDLPSGAINPYIILLR